ncbi:hypothetical protein PAGU2638_14430 [Lysobacter sp. PAGU 2638]
MEHMTGAFFSWGMKTKKPALLSAGFGIDQRVVRALIAGPRAGVIAIVIVDARVDAPEAGCVHGEGGHRGHGSILPAIAGAHNPLSRPFVRTRGRHLSECSPNMLPSVSTASAMNP